MLGLVSHTYNSTWKVHETLSKNSNTNKTKHQQNTKNKVTVKADRAQLALSRLIRLFPNVYMELIRNYYVLTFNDLISHISLITKPQSKCLVYKFRAKELQKNNSTVKFPINGFKYYAYKLEEKNVISSFMRMWNYTAAKWKSATYLHLIWRGLRVRKRHPLKKEKFVTK